MLLHSPNGWCITMSTVAGGGGQTLQKFILSGTVSVWPTVLEFGPGLSWDDEHSPGSNVNTITPKRSMHYREHGWWAGGDLFFQNFWSPCCFFGFYEYWRGRIFRLRAFGCLENLLFLWVVWILDEQIWQRSDLRTGGFSTIEKTISYSFFLPDGTRRL